MKITANLIVEEIEPVLPFWVDRLGFEKAVEVPHEDRLGFVILVKDGIELMYQTLASVREDLPWMAREMKGRSVALFVEVPDLAAVERALAGMELLLPRRRTFYGMDEIGVREPGGNIVIFAQPVPPG